MHVCDGRPCDKAVLAKHDVKVEKTVGQVRYMRDSEYDATAHSKKTGFKHNVGVQG